MPYIGHKPATSFHSLVKQDFSVSATASYTLSQSVTSANDIALFINNVRQEPTYAYSASGTSLTLTAATAGSDDMYCVYLGKAVGTINPASGSVGLAQLSATGTKSSSTFLRGDNSFATVSGSNVLEILTGVCDGRSVTVPSGTYTMPNVTAVQSLTGSYADLTGSEIAYTPPSGTKQVIYSFQHMFTRDGDYPLAHYKFFVDSDEATRYRTTLYGAYTIMLQELRFIISITGSADTTNANLASWSSAKTLKIQAREYTDGSGGSTNTAKAHGLNYWDGGGLSGSGNGFQYKAPILTLTALKDS
tara:strand:- start:512 stop:1423 length:912 start_codon:yes stop_codon:yes gene_type:complete